MDSPDENKIIPSVPRLSWRSLKPDDISAITELATACLQVDGGLPLGAADTYIQKHYLPARAGASIGAFEANGHLVACGAVQQAHTPGEYRATTWGRFTQPIASAG